MPVRRAGVAWCLLHVGREFVTPPILGKQNCSVARGYARMETNPEFPSTWAAASLLAVFGMRLATFLGREV